MSGIMTVRTAVRVFMSSRMSRRPPDSLAVRSIVMTGQVYVADRHGHGLFPAQAGEREDDHHVT
jgi:hypothetical protein